MRRKAQKISQTELAERAGVTRNCVQQLECHEHLPLPSTMFRLMRALHFSQEEAAAFWLEIDAAYMQDRELQEASSPNEQEVTG
ncbi:MAG: helix-turn-helix transcriptional regulator [Subdoligranulum sp.]|nr:helix-turn-helix transcriptional regulator [Subdoligranulum sp.]